QTYFWRSAPPGIDLGTLLLGNPSGLLTDASIAAWYQRLHMDALEQVAWVGPGVLALALGAVFLLPRDTTVRLWLAIGSLFLVWALGPYLVAFGHNLRLPLPGALVRYVPIVSNARIPAQA